ncbi:Polygalacturonase, partial [Cucurbita argyrosperma subsp. sororia]
MFVVAFLVWSSSLGGCHGRATGKHWSKNRVASATHSSKKGKAHSHGGGHNGNRRGGASKTKPPSTKPKQDVPPSLPPQKGGGGFKGGHSSMFNVLNFGARGDGVTDDTKAFQDTWKASCKVAASTFIVPSNYVFLLSPISFSGPYCQPDIIFQLDGTIIAPTDFKVWGKGLLQWLQFTKLIGLTIQGHGVIDGRGSERSELVGKVPSIKPTALRFYGSFNVTVTGIKIQNSPQCHLKFDNCIGVFVHNFSVSSPGDSLNTDGIHLQNSKDVLIHSTTLSCGDDCISIQTGCSNGGLGFVQGVLFSNIQVSEVKIPIVIDQFYCDKVKCSNQTAAVALSGINYERIRGTYTVKPVHFACSDNLPCTDISLTAIELKPLQELYHLYGAFCWQTFGELRTPTVPPIDCLHIGKPSSNQIQYDFDSC